MPKSIVPLFFSYFSPSAAFQWLAPELVSFFPSMCWIYFAFLFFFFVCFFVCLFSSPPCLRRKHHKATPVLQCC